VSNSPLVKYNSLALPCSFAESYSWVRQINNLMFPRHALVPVSPSSLSRCLFWDMRTGLWVQQILLCVCVLFGVFKRRASEPLVRSVTHQGRWMLVEAINSSPVYYTKGLLKCVLLTSQHHHLLTDINTVVFSP